MTKVSGYPLPVAGPHGPVGSDVSPVAAGEIGLVAEMPFFLDDDGAYDPLLNAFLRSLPGDGAASSNTWLAYARDIQAYLDFLRQEYGGRAWLAADRQTLIDYKRVRRGPHAKHPLSPQSWNRAVAALERLYRWAQQEGLVARLPFTHRMRVARQGGERVAVESNRLKDADANPDGVRYVAVEDFRYFRDVGLRGRLPDGTEDPKWRGRFGYRNAAMAELLITTGLRIEEGSCFLAWEVQAGASLAEGERQIVHRLPAAVAKGGRARDIFLPPRVHRMLRDYIEIERENAVADARTPDGRYTLIRDALRVRRNRRRCIPIDGGDPVAIADLTVSVRRRLVERDGAVESPVWLFLAADGAPLGTGAWNKIFAAASARCAEHGRPLYVTPHMLRHTYAVNYLSHLIVETTGRARLADLREPGARAYRRLYGDPLRILQRRLGHASITSTFIYLDHLREAREIADAAAEQWDAMVAGDAPGWGAADAGAGATA